MTQIVFVALGGAVGAVMRFLLAGRVQPLVSQQFLGVPVSTLIVNVLGSLLIGVAYVLLAEKLVLAPAWRSVIMVGFLAAFTTFSTFSLDTVHLLEAGHIGLAISYIIASVLLCVSACWLAMLATRLL